MTAAARRLLCLIGVLCGVLSLAGCADLPMGSGPAGDGWVTLFDRHSNLNGWTLAGEANWRIQQGAVQADLLLGKGPAYLVSKQAYRDFELYAELWVDAETNSGIFIRCANPQKIGADTCYEFNIWDSRPDPSYGTGAIVGVAKVSPMPHAGGHWNTLEITARGGQLSFKLNGVLTASATDPRHAEGHIGLQYGSGIVKFRKVLVRAL
jgi:hypothetical protein